jgi:hypothetical protein
MQPTELVQEINVTPDVAFSVRKRRMLLTSMSFIHRLLCERRASGDQTKSMTGTDIVQSVCD